MVAMLEEVNQYRIGEKLMSGIQENQGNPVVWTAGCFSDTACLVFQAALVRSRNSCSILLGVRYPRAE